VATWGSCKEGEEGGEWQAVVEILVALKRTMRGPRVISNPTHIFLNAIKLDHYVTCTLLTYMVKIVVFYG
jgi:hypothetical protein